MENHNRGGYNSQNKGGNSQNRDGSFQKREGNYQNKGAYPQTDASPERNWVKEFKEEWIKKEFETETVEYCHDFAKRIANDGYTAAQLRKIFSEIKRIQLNKDFSKKDFILLKPKIAYTSAKSKNSQVSKKFTDVILAAHSFVDLKNIENSEI